jgi:hypothetical protein
VSQKPQRESPLLPDWDLARGPFQTRFPGRVGRALDWVYAWYEWAVVVIVSPAALVIYWVVRLVGSAFDARLPPPRRTYASRGSYPVGAPWRSTPWFPPDLLRKLKPPGVRAGILGRLIRRVTRWW